MGELVHSLFRGKELGDTEMSIERKNGQMIGPDFRFVLDGSRLDIMASVDLAGLRKLKKMLDTYESLLVLLEPVATKPPGTVP